MVGTGGFIFGGNADGGPGGGIDGEGGGDVRYWGGDRRLIKWEGTVASIPLGTEPNATLEYVLGLELH